MEAIADGLLAVWMDVEAKDEAELNDWYNREHLLERVSVPGFQNGRRYHAIRGSPQYLALYDLDDPAALSAAPYLERLNQPTLWTRRVMPTFRNTVRSGGRIIARHGGGIGGVVTTCAVNPRPGERDALREGLSSDLFAELAALPQVVRVVLAEAEAVTSSGGTEEIAMRGDDRIPTFVLLVDWAGEKFQHDEVEERATPERLVKLGAEAPAMVGRYRLLQALVSRATPGATVPLPPE